MVASTLPGLVQGHSLRYFLNHRHAASGRVPPVQLQDTPMPNKALMIH